MSNNINVGFGVTVLANGISKKGIDGIGNYTNELHKVFKNSTEVNLSNFAFNTLNIEEYLGAPINQLGKYEINLIKSLVFPSSRMSSHLGESKVDIIHATDHIIPLVRGVPLVATIMDAIILSHPEWYKISKLKIQLWRKIVKCADHLLTISEYSKSEISHHFDIDPSRISVVGLGVNQKFFIPILEKEKKKVLEKYEISGKYFINIGTLQPKKNIENLIEAIRKLPKEIRITYSLIIVGRYGWKSEVLLKKIKKAESEGWCKWLNYVPDNDLRALLQSASLMIFPSLYEGFGLPVLEAFASKIPVVASNTSSIPEVAKNSAILFNPQDISEISSAILKILNNKELTNNLVEKGYDRAKEMSWHRCATETLRVYENVIKNA